MTADGKLAALEPREWAVLALLALTDFALQLLVVPVDADVSWLITVSERVLAGELLYIDIFEVNPPASVWLYLPQVAVAQLVGLRPEALIVFVAATLSILSVVATLRLNDRLAAVPRFPLLFVLGFVTLVLPGGLCAQREHYAFLLALPTAWAIALVTSGRPIRARTLALAGIAAGLIMVIKPQFAFAVILPTVFAVIKSRRWRDLAMAGGAGASVVLGYGLSVGLLAPAYFGLLPMLTEVYGPMREQWPKLLFGVSVATPLALGAAAWILSQKPLPRLVAVLLLMVVGFTLAVIFQGKGYWNHALPGIALAIVAMSVSALLGRATNQRTVQLATIAAIGLGVTITTLMIQPPAGLVRALRETAPPNPSVITLGTDLAVGHPATRLVDGRWAGTRAALFTAAGVRYRTRNLTSPSTATFRHWYDEDLALLAQDVARGRPDVLLIECEDMPWLAREAVARRILQQYRLARRVGDVEIWLRRDGSAPQ